MPTAEWVKAKVRDYYEQMTEESYLPGWAGESLGFHFGIGDENTPSLQHSLLATNAYLADRARIDAGTLVLDAGCGVGGSSIWLAKERGARAIGITLSPTQVEHAKRFAQQRGVEALTRFECMDFAATTFTPRSFDVVWNLESIGHTNDPRGYLAHAFELLRGGGRFVCTDLWAGSRGNPEHPKAMCSGWAMPPLTPLAELARLLAEVGFTAVETEDLTGRVLRSADALRAAAGNTLLRMRAEEAFEGRTPDPVYVGHARAAVAAANGLEDGSITYGFVGGVRPPT